MSRLRGHRPMQTLDSMVEFSGRALGLMDFAERHELAATLRMKIEAVVIEAARLEVNLRIAIAEGRGK